MLGRGRLGWAATLHADGAPLGDPLLSPLHAGLTGVPPVHLSVGMRDLFVNDVRNPSAGPGRPPGSKNKHRAPQHPVGKTGRTDTMAIKAKK